MPILNPHALHRPYNDGCATAAVFDAIIEYMTNSCGIPPTLRELGDLTELYPATVHKCLQHLQELGHITLISRQARGIRVNDAVWSYLPPEGHPEPGGIHPKFYRHRTSKLRQNLPRG